LDNILTNPEELKFRKIRCSNKVFQEKVASAQGAEQFLKAAGFTKTMMKADPSSEQAEEFWVFHPQDEATFVAQLTVRKIITN
jgi:UBX domain-containing protein 6